MNWYRPWNGFAIEHRDPIGRTTYWVWVACDVPSADECPECNNHRGWYKQVYSDASIQTRAEMARRGHS